MRVFSLSPFLILADAAPAGGGAMTQFLILIPLFGLMWFLLIRPQRKRQQQVQEMLQKLKVGDRVITNGGAIGTITKVGEQRVRLSFSDRVEIEFVRSAIGGVITDEEKPEDAIAQK